MKSFLSFPRKRESSFFLTLILVFAFAFPLQAAEIQPVGTPLRKLQRGFLNVVFSPMEISTEMAKEKKNETFPPSWALGFARGGAFMAGRMLAGVYELVTFPIPDYDPIVQPEFAWQHLDTPTATPESVITAEKKTRTV